MHHFNLFSLFIKVNILIELLGVHHLLQILPKCLVLAHRNRTVLAVLLTAINALHRIIAIFVWVIEGVLQVHDQRQLSGILLEDL
jgi:hypothetical protein